MTDNQVTTPVEDLRQDFRLDLNEQIAELALVHPADTLSHEAAQS